MIACTPVHAAVLEELYRACFATPWSEKDIADILAMPGAIGLIAAAHDAPAGFILARRAGDEGEIITLGVMPAHRRQGLARTLIRTAETAIRAAGADKMFLEVAETNRAARALYAAMGYRDAGRRAGYYKSDQGPLDAVIMRADLGDSAP